MKKLRKENLSKYENRLLLSGVFGPYGIKEEYADDLGMQMELLNNQVTREQGIHSPRQFYFTHPLYLLAENLSFPVSVLDFPTWEDFVKELKNNDYTHIGINFIVPNILKAKRMTEYIRKTYPKMKIILGGYGTIVPDLEEIVPHDAKCVGEGVRWIQKYFNEEELLTKPIVHPVVQNPVNQTIYGHKSIPHGAVLLPGLGCENGCEFCVTSHTFHKCRIDLLPTGKDVYDACVKAEREIKARSFSIMDENFLKKPERAKELLKYMEKNNKPYSFEIFSSAEVIENLGVEFLVRLGVKMVWIGVESKKWSHDKVKGINLRGMISKLQRNGIVVNSSAILFLDHHTEETIREDIDWVISLNADLTQFMNYTPYPGTPLHKRLTEARRMKSLEEVPYSHHHGCKQLNWRHPHIDDPKKQISYLRNAFKRKYKKSGPGILNMAITALEGLKSAREKFEDIKDLGLFWNHETMKYEKPPKSQQISDFDYDPYFATRVRRIELVAKIARTSLFTIDQYTHSKVANRKVKYAKLLADELFGRLKTKDRIISFALYFLSGKEYFKLYWNKIRGRESTVYQPPTKITDFRTEERAMRELVRRQIQKWKKEKKNLTWIESKFSEHLTTEHLKLKLKEFKLRIPKMPNLKLMQKMWNVPEMWNVHEIYSSS